MKTIVSLEEISGNFIDVKDKAVSFAAWAKEELERNDAPDSDVVENELPLPRTRRKMLSDGTVSDQENLYEVNFPEIWHKSDDECPIVWGKKLKIA